MDKLDDPRRAQAWDRSKRNTMSFIRGDYVNCARLKTAVQASSILTSDIWPCSTLRVSKLEHGPYCEPLAALSKVVMITLHIAAFVGHHLETIITTSARLMEFITVFYRIGTKRLTWTGGFPISHESFGETGLRLPHFVARLWDLRAQVASLIVI